MWLSASNTIPDGLSIGLVGEKIDTLIDLVQIDNDTAYNMVPLENWHKLQETKYQSIVIHWCQFQSELWYPTILMKIWSMPNLDNFAKIPQNHHFQHLWISQDICTNRHPENNKTPICHTQYTVPAIPVYLRNLAILYSERQILDHLLILTQSLRLSSADLLSIRFLLSGPL